MTLRYIELPHSNELYSFVLTRIISRPEDILHDFALVVKPYFEKFFACAKERKIMTTRDRIKELCNEKGISLPVLESILGFGNGTIVKWDKSDPNTKKLRQVADYFNVSVDYLLGRIDSRNPISPESIDGIYLSIAKDMQSNGIDPDDVRLAVETIMKLRER